MTDKLVVIINSLKVPKIKNILLYEMKFFVPNYCCLQNPWLGRCRPPPQIPVPFVCPQLNLVNTPLPEQNSCVRHCPACKAHLPYYIVTSGLSGSAIFFLHYLTNGTIFGKSLLKLKCLFWLSLQLLSETFLILRRTGRDIAINVHGFSGKVPVIRVRF